MPDPLPPCSASTIRSGTSSILGSLIFWLALSVCLPAEAQPPVRFAYYDADRLYDTVPALFYDDSDYTPNGKLRWSTTRYARKIVHTAAVLDSMHMDLVALAGVETEGVVRDLVAACKEDYCYIHRTFNTFDGLDIVLLYHGDRFFPDRVEQGRGWIYVEGTLDSYGALSAGSSASDNDSSFEGHPAPESNFRTGHNSQSSSKTPYNVSGVERNSPSGTPARRIGILACNNARYATEAIEDCRERHPHVRLLAAGRFRAEHASRHRMRDHTAAAEREGRGNVRYRDGWIMRDRILADSALHASDATVFVRRFLFDLRRGVPLPTYEKRVYRGGYGRLLPVFTCLEENYLEH